MTTKHTPGPWAIRTHDLMQRIQTHDGHTVAIPAMNDGVSALACSANARLISAAPELLAALQWAAARVQVLNDEGNPALSAWLPEARAAIATATGEA